MSSLGEFHDELLRWVLSISAGQGPGFLLGVNGPQGAGKSTLTKALCERLSAEGKRAISVSIDDFYLTRTEQLALAAANPQNRYLQARGYPGTHDLALGSKVLQELKQKKPGEVRVPRYDKSAHHGKGDRADFTLVSTPQDVIFLEGWMLGFPPLSTLPDSDLAAVNEALRGYRAWHRLLDGFLQLVPEDPRLVLSWRVEAEEKMKAAGRPGMTESEIRAYVELFLPAYAAYLPALEAHPPVTKNLRRITIGKNRLPLFRL